MSDGADPQPIFDQRNQQVEHQVNVAGDVHIPPAPPTVGQRIATGTVSFLAAYWPETTLAILLGVAGALLYIRYQAQYRLSVWSWPLFTAATLAALVAFLQAARSQRRNRPYLPITAVIFALLAVVLFALVIYPAARPAPFPDDKFGVAVATFRAANSDWRATVEGEQIANRIQETLEREIVTDKELEQEIGTPKRIGIILDEAHLKREAKRLNADLVIWGTVSTTDEKDVIVVFNISQVSELFDDPDTPILRPVTDLVWVDTLPLKYGEETNEFVSKLDPYSTGIASLGLGLVHYWQRNYSEALGRFNRASDAFSDESVAAEFENLGLLHYYVGKTHQSFGDYQESIAELAKAIDEIGPDPALLYSQAYNYRAQDDAIHYQEYLAQTIEAARQIKKLEKGKEERTRVAYTLATLYELEGDYGQALAEYSAIIADDDPEFFVGYIASADLLRWRCDTKTNEVDPCTDDVGEAQRLLNRANELVKERPVRRMQIEMIRGHIARDQGDDAQAQIHYANALMQVEGHMRDLPLLSLADLYADAGRWEDADQKHAERVDILDGEARAHAQYGGFLMDWAGTLQREGAVDAAHAKYGAAAAEYALAIREDPPDRPYLMTRRATALAQQGEGDQAITILEEALGLSNVSQWESYIRAEYGRLLHDNGNGDRTAAIAQFEQAVALADPPSPEHMLYLAKLYLADPSTPDYNRERAVALLQSILANCHVNYPQKAREQTRVDYRAVRKQWIQDTLIATGAELNELGESVPDCPELPREELR